MNICIIQARMGSSRLPGKVLKKMGGKTILEHLINRISPSKKLHEIIVATTQGSEDDCIADLCKSIGIRIFRGSEWDVLDRYYQTIQHFNLKPATIIRAMADSPLQSSEVIDFAIHEFYSQKVDFFSNSNFPPDILMDGCDVDVFTYESLGYAWHNAKLLSQREHVTPYIKDCGKFRCAYKKSHPNYNFKLAVDNENDFKTVSEIFRHFHPNEMFTIKELIDLLHKNPEILKHNKNSIINEGYKKSIAKE